MVFKGKIKLYSLLAILFLNFIVFYSVSAETRNGVLKIVFLDIGQGDAIFIESPSGNQILIDAGPDKSILNALGRIMPFHDKSIDVILATHPDSDHIGGFPSVLKNYEIGKYITNGATSSTAVSEELERRTENMEKEIVRAGDVVDMGDGAYLKILYPNADPKGADTNAYSVVAELFYGNTKILLTGDASSDVESYLVFSSGIDLKSDILKVAHHGSKNSLLPEFFYAVSPEFSVISAGKDNRYGHPHQEILDALMETGTKILGTYEKGDIVFETNGENLILK